MASENIVENFSPRGHREAVELGDQAFSSELLVGSCAALGKKKRNLTVLKNYSVSCTLHVLS